MSRGGRGGSTSTTGVRAIANVLGIARQDVGAFMQFKKDPPPTYPPLNRSIVPLNETPDLKTTTDVKLELLKQFHESSHYMMKRGQKDISRYTDKYSSRCQKGADFSRIPSELNWKGGKNVAKDKPAKRRKLDDSMVAARLEKLEAAEKVEPEVEVDNEDVDEPEENDAEKKAEGNESPEEFSDDDYLEEDNDYAQNYFDNGEGYVDMGIKDLSKVIADNAEKGVREAELSAFFGRKVAIDASMSMYQFLIAIRPDKTQNLTNERGETTSHLNGMFYRTIRMMENGLKPILVFDGKPPEMKSEELDKRREKREEAEKLLETAKEQGDTEGVEKQQRRLVKVTQEQGDQCKELLRAMGVPVVEAPSEAEAQCAELVKKGKAYATGTEDMDALTFGSNVLLRHLTFSEAKKLPIQEYSLDKILAGLDLTYEQFIDLCIMLGCDYCGSIKGIGQKKAMELIRQHKSIENILENLDQEVPTSLQSITSTCHLQKYKPPKNWKFDAARKLFLNPNVTDGSTFQFKWSEPNEEAIMKLMVEEQGFNEERIRTALARLKKSKSQSTQGRIDSFFKPTSTVTTTTAQKRKAEEEKAKNTKKPKKPTAGKKGKA
ncbi:Flap endonuclease 1 [Aphelenchoides besseyi]|nr:Flap endonuclease 1 [Aphelenchoides besseyi]